MEVQGFLLSLRRPANAASKQQLLQRIFLLRFGYVRVVAAVLLLKLMFANGLVRVEAGTHSEISPSIFEDAQLSKWPWLHHAVLGPRVRCLRGSPVAQWQSFLCSEVFKDVE